MPPRLIDPYLINPLCTNNKKTTNINVSKKRQTTLMGKGRRPSR
jgi:hypothetical protein